MATEACVTKTPQGLGFFDPLFWPDLEVHF